MTILGLSTIELILCMVIVLVTVAGMLAIFVPRIGRKAAFAAEIRELREQRLV